MEICVISDEFLKFLHTMEIWDISSRFLKSKNVMEIWVISRKFLKFDSVIKYVLFPFIVGCKLIIFPPESPFNKMSKNTCVALDCKEDAKATRFLICMRCAHVFQDCPDLVCQKCLRYPEENTAGIMKCDSCGFEFWGGYILNFHADCLVRVKTQWKNDQRESLSVYLGLPSKIHFTSPNIEPIPNGSSSPLSELDIDVVH